MKKNTTATATVKEEVKEETTTVEKEVKKRVKSALAEDLATLSKASRSLRKVCYKYVRRISGTANKEEYMKKLIDLFAEMIVKLESIQGEMDFKVRISTMSAVEKAMLLKLLSENAATTEAPATTAVPTIETTNN